MKKKVILVLLILLMVAPVFASTGTSTGMPWETVLEKIYSSLSGTVVRLIGLMLIIGGGLSLAFTGGQGMTRLFWVLIGVGVAINASPLIMRLFGVSGALL
jgi:type IV secretory pathway VirB2 component (pilin)